MACASCASWLPSASTHNARMTTTVLLIFGLVYLGMILGGLPFLQLDRTGVALLMRGARQQLVAASGIHLNESDKIAISIAQDLSVIGLTPFGSDCKLLMAVESARSTASNPDRGVDLPLSNRLLGGLAISF